MSDEYEMFLGKFRVKKINIVNDHCFLMPGSDERCEVRPVSLKQIENDKDKLAKQEIYLFPQPGDLVRQIFLVYYDKNIDINNNN